MHGIRIVVFDLGGVIVRICRSWQEGVRAAGLEVRGGTDSAQMRELRRSCAREYQEGRIGCEEFHLRLAETTGGLYSPEEIERIHHAWVLEEYPGVGGVVDAVRASGAATGVLSNTNHGHWTRLARMPLLGRIDHVHASHLLGVSKPSAEIYRAFEQRTGFAAGQILFFDDLEENVESARAVGWQAERIDHEGDTAAQMMEQLRVRGLA